MAHHWGSQLDEIGERNGSSNDASTVLAGRPR